MRESEVETLQTRRSRKAWRSPSRFRLDLASRTRGGAIAGYSEQTICHLPGSPAGACYTSMGFGTMMGCRSTGLPFACSPTPSCNCGAPTGTTGGS